MPETSPILAARIAGFRNKRRQSQAQLAQELGVSQGTVTHWENEEQPPNSTNLLKLGRLADGEDRTYFWGMALQFADTELVARKRHGRKLRVKPEVAEQLHTALDLILERSPEELIKTVAEYLTQRAGKYGGPR